MNALPPPLPAAVRRQRTLRRLAWTVGTLGLVAALGWGGLWGYRTAKRQVAARSAPGAQLNLSFGAGETEAAKPIVWPTNSATSADVRRRSREFRLHQYLAAFRQNPGTEDDAKRQAGDALIRAWIDLNFGTNEAAHDVDVPKLANEYVAIPGPAHPLALIAAASAAPGSTNQSQRYRQAWQEFPKHPKITAYPRWFACIQLLERQGNQVDGGPTVDDAVSLFGEMLRDGGLRTEDLEEIAEILLTGWGKDFYRRHKGDVSPLLKQAGEPVRWLALVLEGQQERDAAWAARGGGYANTVSEKGWREFSQHMAKAKTAFTAAWELNPAAVRAPASMIGIAMGDGDEADMRLWFDRACLAQADSHDAWHNFRWGLRPRWHGSEAAILALGRAALETGRFDTDVPRRLFDCISDLEAEAQLSFGEHIYGRDEIWPLLERMYRGYVGAYPEHRGWRTTFATVAYLAGQYGVAREQLEALRWEPVRDNTEGWNRDLSLLPEQVAAFSGPHGEAALRAEQAYRDELLEEASQQFRKLLPKFAEDPRAAAFVASRLATIDREQQLPGGEWISLLPGNPAHPGWHLRSGELREAGPAGIVLRNGRQGHLFTSRIRPGAHFTVRAEVELPLVPGQKAEAGVNFGIPEWGGQRWQSVRIRRTETGRGEAALNLAWTRNGSVRPAKLNDGLNVIEVRVFGEAVTVLVNEVEVLNNVAFPHNFGVPYNQIVLGVGGEADAPDSEIRYRKLEAKSL